MGTGAAACAPAAGWTRTGRVCESTDPPVLCLQAEPDAPIELQAGDITLLPAECASGPEDESGGSIEARIIDGRGGETTRRLRVPKGRRTTVVVRPGLEIDVRRGPCDRRPAP